MKKSQFAIKPVLLGLDLAAYSTARAFFEYSELVSDAFGRYPCGITSFSKIIKAHICTGMDNVESAAPVLFRYSEKMEGKRLILVPCSDLYIEVAERITEMYPARFHTLIPRKEHRDLLADKARFYGLLLEMGFSVADYSVISSPSELDAVRQKIKYPIVLKAADNRSYSRYISEGLKKVWFLNDEDKCREAISRIYSSGYKGALVLQERIGGERADMSVLTTFSDSTGRVKRAVLGRVVLEERGESSCGNYSAIITEPITALSYKLIDMLDSISYVGICNFDIIKGDSGEFVLDANVRQGRSCDYVRAAGVNLAELIVRDMRGESIERSFDYKRIYWHYPDHGEVLKNISKENAELCEALRRDGASYSPLNYVKDLKSNFIRRGYVRVHSKRLGKRLAAEQGN